MKVIARYTYKTGKQERMVSVVHKLDFDVMKKIKAAISPGHIVMTLDELTNATDVFPLEILTMKTTGHLIDGDDVFQEININKKDVRRQLEFEFRSKVIHLRDLFFNSKSDKDLRDTLSNALPVLTPLIEGMLFLKNESEGDITKAIGKVNKLYSINMNLLKEPVPKSHSDIEKYLSQLYAKLLMLSEKLDKLKV